MAEKHSFLVPIVLRRKKGAKKFSIILNTAKRNKLAFWGYFFSNCERVIKRGGAIILIATCMFLSIVAFPIFTTCSK